MCINTDTPKYTKQMLIDPKEQTDFNITIKASYIPVSEMGRASR